MQENASSVNDRAQAGLCQRSDSTADRSNYLVKSRGSVALGDIAAHLFKVLPHPEEHEFVRVFLFKAVYALIREQLIDTGKATKALIHGEGNVAYPAKACQTMFH